jgi:hypothetical protein
VLGAVQDMATPKKRSPRCATTSSDLPSRSWSWPPTSDALRAPRLARHCGRFAAVGARARSVEAARPRARLRRFDQTETSTWGRNCDRTVERSTAARDSGPPQPLLTLTSERTCAPT